MASPTVVGLQPEEWARAAVKGKCALTTPVGNDCWGGDSGSFTLRRQVKASTTFASAAKGCLRQCSVCPRCHFLTVSVERQECSWFFACNRSTLRFAALGLYKTAPARAVLSGDGYLEDNWSRQRSKRLQNRDRRRAHPVSQPKTWLPLTMGEKARAAQCAAANRVDGIGAGMDRLVDTWTTLVSFNFEAFDLWLNWWNAYVSLGLDMSVLANAEGIQAQDALDDVRRCSTRRELLVPLRTDSAADLLRWRFAGGSERSSVGYELPTDPLQRVQASRERGTWGTKEYKSIVSVRAAVILHAFRHARGNLIYADVDAVWRSDPRPYFVGRYVDIWMS